MRYFSEVEKISLLSTETAAPVSINNLVFFFISPNLLGMTQQPVFEIWNASLISVLSFSWAGPRGGSSWRGPAPSSFPKTERLLAIAAERVYKTYSCPEAELVSFAGWTFGAGERGEGIVAWGMIGDCDNI